MGALLLTFLSAYGWGALPTWLCYRGKAPFWSLQVAFGVAAWVAIGGVANLVGLANRPTALALYGGGLVMGLGWLLWRLRSASRLHTTPDPTRVSAWANTWAKWKWMTRGWHRLPEALVSALSLGLIYAVVPGRPYNAVDDFHTYFERIARMLQTGSLGGNPFDLLGVDSLGGQIFLQGIFSAVFSLPSVFIFDTVFCFALSGFLIIGFARWLTVPTPYLWAGLGCFLLINPMIVNNSALFSGTALLLATIITACMMVQRLSLDPAASVTAHAITSGALLGCLFALKSTLAVAALAFGLLFGIVALASPLRARVIKPLGMALAAALGTVLPWLLVYRDHYGQALALRGSDNPASPVQALALVGDPRDVEPWLSLSPLIYGGTFAAYTILVLAAGALFLWAGYRIARGHSGGGLAPAVTIAVVSGMLVATFVVLDQLFLTALAIRYACPVILAAIPALVVLIGAGSPRRGAPTVGMSARVTRVAWCVAPLSVLAMVLVLFGPSAIDRTTRYLEQGTTLSFSTSSRDWHYNRTTLSTPAREMLRNVQARTRPGETILTWIAAPFLLDFNRNPIYATGEGGLVSPWMRLPLGQHPDTLRQDLVRRGIRYVLWEPEGFGMKSTRHYRKLLSSGQPTYIKIAYHSLFFVSGLEQARRRAQVLFNDPQYVLIDLASNRKDESPGQGDGSHDAPPDPAP